MEEEAACPGLDSGAGREAAPHPPAAAAELVEMGPAVPAERRPAAAPVAAPAAELAAELVAELVAELAAVEEAKTKSLR